VHLAPSLAALGRQSMQMGQTLLSDRPLFDQFRVHHWHFCIAMIDIDAKRNEP